MRKNSFTSVWRVLCTTLFSVLILASPGVQAQRNLAVAAAAPIEQRVALVIGNGAYKDAPLRNPSNYAADVAAALRELGWKVTLKTNAGQRQMKEAIREFGSELARGGVGLFYFAGHGIQYRGENYLVPVGANIEREAHVEDETVGARFVLAQMEEARNRVNIVIMDACRNNPYSRSFRSVARGLAQMDAAQGTLVAFATAPGSVAADGEGRNGVYTKHLLRNIRAPGVPAELMFKRVRDGVIGETKDKQTPWESSSLRGEDFYFSAATGVPAGADPAAIELAFWDSVKTSTHRADFEEYLVKYPQGRFAGIARNRMQASSIQGSAAAPLGQSIAPTGAAEDLSRSLELEFWNNVKENKNPDELKAYLEQYPNGRFAALARTRIRALEQSRPTTNVTSVPDTLRAAPTSGNGDFVNCYSAQYGGRIWTFQSNCD